MEPHLPREILYRPKMGFAVPLARWFRGPLRERVRHALFEGALAEGGLFNRETLQHVFEVHQTGRRDYSAPLWSLLMFEAFLRQTGTEPPKASPRVSAAAALVG
jgi:asparagine synthase (glutamine-hydrolysing)